MAGRSWRSLIVGFIVLCTTTFTLASADAGAAERDRETREAPPKHSRPTWFRNVPRHGIESHPSRSDDIFQIVLQRERRDGAELLTLRYPVATAGRLQTYAGVGLNRAVYFAAPSAAPTLFNKRNRHRSLGGAAEFGLELRVNENVHLNAELRWIDIDRDAITIRTRQGLVAADPVAFGVSLGWRFR